MGSKGLGFIARSNTNGRLMGSKGLGFIAMSNTNESGNFLGHLLGNEQGIRSGRLSGEIGKISCYLSTTVTMNFILSRVQGF